MDQVRIIELGIARMKVEKPTNECINISFALKSHLSLALCLPIVWFDMIQTVISESFVHSFIHTVVRPFISRTPSLVHSFICSKKHKQMDSQYGIIREKLVAISVKYLHCNSNSCRPLLSIPCCHASTLLSQCLRHKVTGGNKSLISRGGGGLCPPLPPLAYTSLCGYSCAKQ